MLDIRTMYFLLMLSSFVAGICVLNLNVPAGDRRRSAVEWAVGSFAVALGLLLVGLRDMIPLWVSAVLGNNLLFCGFLFFYRAVCRLLEVPQRNQPLVLAAVVYFLLFHLSVTLGMPVRYRIAMVSVMLALVAISMIRVSRQPHPSRQHTQSALLLMQGFYGIVLVTAVGRGIHSAFFTSGATLIFEPTLVQIVSFLGYYFALIGAGIAFLLLQSAMAYHDLALVANNDMLTGVRNRRNFMDMAERDLALAQRMWRPLTVMMLDLDHFKRINDEFGHLTGDEALRRFGEILRGTVRSVDLVGRYGGEEFCIVLSDTTPEVARHTAERIRSEFAAVEILLNNRRVPLSVSIGIAGTLASGEARSMQQLINAADIALYDAKHAGRNCIRQAA
jgi:diguanylate cyclase (GGDEF)-like protein